MTKILFICHGNICRSPTAEFILKDMVRKAGLEKEFFIDSAATTYEEIGNPVYPPTKKLLEAHGIDCSGKLARHMTKADYDNFDLIIYMDEENRSDLYRYYRGDPDGKLRNLMDYAGKIGEEVYDPWYSRNFQRAWDDIEEGCRALLDSLTDDTVTLDFSSCMSKAELYAVLRREMNWQEWYGENLDALWDILTGLPHRGKSFIIIPPAENAPENVRKYASLIEEVFDEANGLKK